MRSTFYILFYVKFEDDNLAFVRDIFAFVCFTALSFIDVKNLTTDNIVDINGDKWIIGRRHKRNGEDEIRDIPCCRYGFTTLQVLVRIRESPQSKWRGSGTCHETGWQQRPERLTGNALQERWLHLQGFPN